MATYKMIQDIEAEDHIIGPLSLRQFIYALITAALLYANFLVFNSPVPFLLIVFVPPMLFTGFFAFPFGGDQPTEVWALAKIRFLFKPRRRIWDQSGVKELVSITVPKKVERTLTNGLSQIEVKSRLSALANTIDSRGWAVKNVNVNLYANPGTIEEDSDRLVGADSFPMEVPNYDVQASDDIMDERNNPIAHQFDEMITRSTQAHRQQLMQEMNAPTGQASGAASTYQPPQPQADYWFLNQSPQQPAHMPEGQAMFNAPGVILPGVPGVSAMQPAAAAPIITDMSDEELMARVHANEANKHVANSRMHTLQPLGSNPAPYASAAPATISAPSPAQPPQNVPPQPSPAPADPAILSLARNNDLNISTLAREAEKSKRRDNGGSETNDGEVVISLR